MCGERETTDRASWKEEMQWRITAAGKQLVHGLCWWSLSQQDVEKLLEVTDDSWRIWQKSGGVPGGMAGYHKGLRGRCVGKGRTWQLTVVHWTFGSFVACKANMAWGSALVMTSEAESIADSKIEVGCSKTGSNDEKVTRVRLLIWVEIGGGGERDVKRQL